MPISTIAAGSIGHDAADISCTPEHQAAIRTLLCSDTGVTPVSEVDASTTFAAGASQKLYVDPQDPLDTAVKLLRRAWHYQGYRTLHRYQDTWWAWIGTHYEQVTPEAMRARVYQLTESAQVITQHGPMLGYHLSRFRQLIHTGSHRLWCHLLVMRPDPRPPRILIAMQGAITLVVPCATQELHGGIERILRIDVELLRRSRRKRSAGVNLADRCHPRV